MTPEVVVVTALLGAGPDQLNVPPPVEQGVRYVCVTDRTEGVPKGWDAVDYAGPRVESSRQQARWVRAHVPDLFPQAEATIWLDASFDFHVSPSCFVDRLRDLGTDMLAFRHPDRHRIRDEAAAIIEAGQITPIAAAEVLARYAADGFDTDRHPQTILTAGGVLVRGTHPRVTRFGETWWRELKRYGERFDQLSLDYCAREAGLTIGYLEGHYAEHQWLYFDRDRHRGRVPAHV